MSASTPATSVASRPIPALYTVYILRSTMRHASLYIGSTTDPPRRLKQHNGAIRGGAARTARASLRPWEMVALVSGFPGSLAALKFEWALTNPHLSLHIPSGARLTVARQKKKNGHPRRPPAGLQSIVANLHLLLRVPSFARWPLRLHVFSPDVHKVWEAWCSAGGATAAGAAAPPATTTIKNHPIDVVTDFGPAAAPAAAASEPPDPSGARPWGIHALPLDYAPLRNYVDKARDIFAFERADSCVLCREPLPQDRGLYAVCPNDACEATGHLQCWSEHLLSAETTGATGSTGAAVGTAADDTTVLLPLKGHCPECHGPVRWVDMMKELTLRLRAPKEVAKLVKAKRREEKAALAAEKRALARKTAKNAGVVLDSEDDDLLDDPDDPDDLGDDTDDANDADDADSTGALSDSSGAAALGATANRRAKKAATAGTKAKRGGAARASATATGAKATKVPGAARARKTGKASTAAAVSSARPRARARSRSSSPEIIIL